MVAQLAAHGGLIPLTIPKVRRLVYCLVARILTPLRADSTRCAGDASTTAWSCAPVYPSTSSKCSPLASTSTTRQSPPLMLSCVFHSL